MDQIDLADEQKDSLRQFMEVTNVQDESMAIATLASLDWNVERAIEAHLMQDNDDIIIDDQDDADVVYVPHPSQGLQRQVVDDDVQVINGGRGNNENGVPPPENRRVTRSALRGIEASSSNHQNAVRPVPPPRRPQEPVSDEELLSDDDEMYEDGHDIAVDLRVQRNIPNVVPLVPIEFDDVNEALQNFVAVFENRYCSYGGPSPVFMPHFFTESLPNAIREAFDNPIVSDRRPLAVYVHNEKSIASNIFVSQILCSEVISSLLRHQFVLWPWDVTHEQNLNKLRDWLNLTNLTEIREAVERIVMRVGSETFPMIAIVVRDKGRFTLLDVCYGMDSQDQVMTKLILGVDTFSKVRMTEESERRERQEREAIRNEQHAEYEASLAADRARIEAKQREAEETKAEEERLRKEHEEEMLRREKVADSLPSEPSETEKDIINVKFRLPEGEQCMRRFRKNESITILINYLSSKGFAPTSYKYFNSDFPKKEITSHFDTSKTFAEAAWPLREQIFVDEI